MSEPILPTSKEQILTWLRDADMCVKLAACGESKAFVNASRLIGKAREALSGDSPAPEKTPLGPPWEFDRYVNGQLKAEGIKINRALTFEQALRAAIELAGPYDVLVPRQSVVETNQEASYWRDLAIKWQAEAKDDLTEIERLRGLQEIAQADSLLRQIGALEQHNGRLRAALRLILPLAKGYNPPGQSQSARRTCNEWIAAAEAQLSGDESPSETKAPDTLESLASQCQALWRTNVTLVCRLPKGHDGNHCADNRWTWTGEVDARQCEGLPLTQETAAPLTADTVCSCGKRLGEHPAQPPWWPCMMKPPEKAPVTSAETCPAWDQVQHKEHNGKCVYCGAPMPPQKASSKPTGLECGDCGSHSIIEVEIEQSENGLANSGKP